MSGHPRLVILLFALCFMGLAARSASAQSSISFSGGASIDPTQAYGGVAWESPNIAGRFHLRPGIDGGFGDGLRLATINLDVTGRFQLGTTGWSLVSGGGPTITVSKFTGELEELPRELHAGFSYLFGFEHDNGFFTEFRLGSGSYVPQLKIGAGWSVEIR